MTAKAKRRVFWVGLLGTAVTISVVSIASTLPGEEERFVTAIRKGDAATVSDLLSKRSELAQLELPAGKGGGTTSVLELAIEFPGTQNGVLRQLLDHGAVPQKYPGILVYARNTEAAGLLIDHGADVNQRGKYGDAPLHFFVSGNDTTMAEFLLNHGADVNVRNTRGDTPLHTAAREGSLNGAKLLVTKGADINLKSQDGKTPLDCAMIAVWNEDAYHMSQDRIRKNREVGAYLLSCGSPCTVFDVAWLGDVERLSKQVEADPSLVNAKANGEPLLFAAVRGGSTDAVEYLLSHGAQLDARGRSEQTPLQVAAYIGHSGVAKVLLDHGAIVDARGRWGETALHWAAFRGNADVAAVLLNRGADPNIQATDHTVDLNVMADDTNPVERELTWFATLEDQRQHGGQIAHRRRLAFTAGDTPLHVAAYWNHPDVVRLLIARGADVKTTDHWGITVLHLAVASAYAGGGQPGSVPDHTDIVQQLLANGADPMAKTQDGFTAVELARRIENKELVQLLSSQKRP
jgi:ankyrin repeat protein